MDWFRSARRIRRPRASRPRRTGSPMRLEALEERTLLSLTLIKDINPAPLYPSQITGAGGDVYFVTQAADGGSELDVKTAAGTKLLKEFPGANSSISLTPVGSKLFFFEGQRLWVTNGTRAGTRLVKKTIPGGGNEPTVVGHELYFTADVTHGNRVRPLLFKSNGTAAGTVPVSLPAGSARFDNPPGSLVDYDGALYFGIGDRLMKSSGTRTELVNRLGPPHANAVTAGSVGDLTLAGGMLYFTFPDASQQGEDLYATNGTARGTTLLKDFDIAGESGYALSDFTAVGSRLFFGADVAGQGPGLWVSDGTPAGTTLVKVLGAPSGAGAGVPGSVGPPILTATAAGSRLFFTTEPSGRGTAIELWVSDGTAAGTTELADIDPANTN